MIIFIAAVDNNFLIGNEKNELPWSRIPEDMRHFRDLTMGHTVVMGRKTFVSIGSTPLKNRENIVLTTDTSLHLPNVIVEHNVDAILSRAEDSDVYIIGGSKLFQTFLPYVSKMYLTHIKESFEGNVYFPLQNFAGWSKKDEKQIKAGSTTPYDLVFITYEKTS